VRLSALAGAVGIPLSGDERDITGISLDSRQVQPGQLFVAIPGANTDGTRFIPDAIARGAIAICATRRWMTRAMRSRAWQPNSTVIPREIFA
jgi:UDP-N-acetylmuramyl pentapeptide synthase